MARIQNALAAAIFLFATAALADTKPDHKPSATCKDADLEERVITEQLAKEPDRPHIVVDDPNRVATFIWNMRWAFDIQVDADKLYVIKAMTPTSAQMHVHLFTVKQGCIVRYTLTWGSVIAEMLRYDAWERNHPPIEGQPPTPVPAGRPAAPLDKEPTEEPKHPPLLHR